jgi:hypothetical protein
MTFSVGWETNMNPTPEEKEKFSLEIEKVSRRFNVNYIEAILLHCEENNIEIETVPSMINEILKQKIEIDAQNLRYLPASSRLPL